MREAGLRHVVARAADRRCGRSAGARSRVAVFGLERLRALARLRARGSNGRQRCCRGRAIAFCGRFDRDDRPAGAGRDLSGRLTVQLTADDARPRRFGAGTAADRARATAAAFSARFALASGGIARRARAGAEAIAAAFAASPPKPARWRASLGEKISAGVSAVSARIGPMATSAGEKMSAGASAVSAKAGLLAKSIGEKMSTGPPPSRLEQARWPRALAKECRQAPPRFGQSRASGEDHRRKDVGRGLRRLGQSRVFWPRPAARERRQGSPRSQLTRMSCLYLRGAAATAAGVPAPRRQAAGERTPCSPGSSPNRPAAFGLASETELSSAAEGLSSPAEGLFAGRRIARPARIGSLDLSQMLIISGVVLLVFGAVLVGSGLVLRARPAPDVVAEADKPLSPHAVLWFYEEPDLPIVERSVFSAELTPKGVRLTGLAIKAENNSDDALRDLESVVKPDAKLLDLKLEVKLDAAPARETARPSRGGGSAARRRHPAARFLQACVSLPASKPMARSPASPRRLHRLLWRADDQASLSRRRHGEIADPISVAGDAEGATGRDPARGRRLIDAQAMSPRNQKQLTEVSAPQPLMLRQALNWLQQRVLQPATSAVGSSAVAVHTLLQELKSLLQTRTL